MLLSEAIKKYAFWSQYGRFEPVTPATLKTSHKTFNIVLRHIGDMDVETINLDTIMRLKQAMLDRGGSIGYVERVLIYVRSLLRYCREDLGMNIIDPKTIKLPRRQWKPVEYLTFEELQVVYENMDEPTIQAARLKAFVSFLLDTGMRISEALAFDRNQIDRIKNRTIVMGKGRKTRVVFYHEWSVASIDNYLALRTDDNPALFVSHYDGKHPTRWSSNCAGRYLTELSRKIDIHVTAHKLRRTSATFFRNAGGDIHDIQHFLGHSKIATTQFYIGIDYDKIQKAHDAHVNYGVVERQMVKPVRIAWAKRDGWLQCRECGTTARRHAANGYCDVCNIRIKRLDKIRRF